MSLTLPRWFSSSSSSSSLKKMKKRSDKDGWGDTNRGYRSLERNKKLLGVAGEGKDAHTYENAAFLDSPGVESGCFRVVDRSMNETPRGGGGAAGHAHAAVPAPTPTHDDILRARRNLRKTLSVPCALQQQQQQQRRSSSSTRRRQEHREFLRQMSRSKTRRSPRDALPSRPGEEDEDEEEGGGEGFSPRPPSRSRLAATSEDTATSLDEGLDDGAGEDEAFWPSPPASVDLAAGSGNVNFDVEEGEGANEAMADKEEEEFRCWSSNGPSFTPPPLPEGITSHCLNCLKIRLPPAVTAASFSLKALPSFLMSLSLWELKRTFPFFSCVFRRRVGWKGGGGGGGGGGGRRKGVDCLHLSPLPCLSSSSLLPPFLLHMNGL